MTSTTTNTNQAGTRAISQAIAHAMVAGLVLGLLVSGTPPLQAGAEVTAAVTTSGGDDSLASPSRGEDVSAMGIASKKRKQRKQAKEPAAEDTADTQQANQTAAQAPEAQEAPNEDPLEKELVFIRKVIINALANLHRGVAGISAHDRSNAPDTPGRRCCSANIDNVSKGLAKVRNLLRSQSSCYERKRDVKGVEAVTVVHRDMRSLERAMTLFGEAASSQQAAGNLAGAQRAYLNLMESIEAMPACEDQ